MKIQRNIFRKVTPLYNAKSEENILAEEVVISTTGPIPVRIIHAI